VSIWDC